MNVFVIPSWYPSKRSPISGIFFREQAEALVRLHPELRILVSTWGFGECSVPISRPLQALRALAWRICQKHDQVRERNGVWELFNPILTWSERLPWGGLGGLLRANRRNFLLAKSEFGAIDLIHAHVSFPAGFVARNLAAEMGIPYVLTEHMGPFPFPSMMGRNGDIRPEIRLAVEGASAVIAVSHPLARNMAAFGLAVSAVIPNMVDERCFAPAKPSPGKFAFLTVCGIVPAKGIEDLIRAVALWNPDPGRFEFSIVGDGDKREEYQRLADRLGVSDRIRWLGPISREEVPELFRRCHVYVMPSHRESFGVAYVEAIACGKPVIATRCGGPEYIVNSCNGRLVDVGDVRALAEVMAQVAESWTNFDAAVIRRDFEQRFSPGVVTDQLLSVYRLVVSERR